MKRAPKKPAAPAPAKPPLDPIVEDTIERAMRPYLGVLPPEGLKTMREILEDTLTTHPVALEALTEMRGEPVVDKSGTRPRREGEDDGEGGAA